MHVERKFPTIFFTAFLVPVLSLGCAGSDGGDDGDDTADATSAADETEGSGDAGDGASDTGETADTTGDEGDTGTPGGIERWELRMPDFSPPPVQTFYSCYAFNIPVEQAVHIVGFEPKVTDPHVHHYIVEMYDEAQERDPMEQCEDDILGNMVWGWAPGGEPLTLPEDVGFRSGGTGTVSFVLQVHYDNPLGDTFVDTGGFDVLYTEELRTHDAGVLSIGGIEDIMIPPQTADYDYMHTCSSSETSALEPDTNVIGTWLHAHELGTRLWTDVFRDGQMIGELGREDPYDFDKQTFKPIEFTLQPGDELQTHCVFANPNDFPVNGGPETSDEMCLNFLLYWPDNPAIATCGEI